MSQQPAALRERGSAARRCGVLLVLLIGGSVAVAAQDEGRRCPAVAGPRDVCNTCGQQDGYTLALSWQPAFCEVQGRDKPECRTTDPAAPQGHHFSLHGLWPEQSVCRTRYGFCGEVRRPESHFDRYPEVNLSAATRSALAAVMPSAAVHTGLERHEWYKHGTCTGWSADAYFAIAADLVRQFNASGMAAYVNQNLGQEVSVRDFFETVDRNLGAGARDRVSLVCNRDGDLLLEVRVNLAVNLAAGASLQDLIQGGRRGSGVQNCRRRFTIDPIGF